MDEKPKRRGKPANAVTPTNKAASKSRQSVETVSPENTLSAPRVAANQVEVAFLSNVGRVRSNNEDSFSAFTASIPRLNNTGPENVFTFLVVADGMGGHEGGEVASNLAVRSMSAGIVQNFYLPTVEGRPPGRNGQTLLEALAFLMEDANQAILQEGHQKRTTMGTTLTCAVLIGQTAIVGHVGDSRLYILAKSTGKLRQVTTDHSVVQRLVDMGTLTPQEAQASPQRSVLYMTVGQKPQVEPDVELVPLGDVAAMLLCSDGLWEMVGDDAIEETLKTPGSAAQVCQSLVEAANAAGGVDNVTVVLARM